MSRTNKLIHLQESKPQSEDFTGITADLLVTLIYMNDYSCEEPQASLYTVRHLCDQKEKGRDKIMLEL